VALRIRVLQIRIETPDGRYGTQIVFENGLCILRAPNTSGKSTCLQAMVYALGLEGMLSASHEVPLPQAVTDALDDGTSHIVLESSVLLEIENHEGLRMTVKRSIKGPGDRRLITVWEGPALSDPSESIRQQDYYVRIGRAATSAAGFHTKLAQFLGWTLPIVAKYDGGEAPLYLECIFPLIFVEQKKGWTVLPARFPQYLGLRDVAKRGVEFLLALDAYRISFTRQQLREQLTSIRASWKAHVEQLSDLASSVNAVVQNVPLEPTAAWPPTIAPSLQVPTGQSWVPVATVLVRRRETLNELMTESLPRIADIAAQTEAELEALQNTLAEQEFVLQRAAFDDLQTEQNQSESIVQRLAALNDDLRRYQDTKRLLDFGSQHAVEIATGFCPTCHQSIADSLLPQDGLQQVMTVEENIAFIKAQIEVFSAMQTENLRLVNARVAQVEALRTEVSDIRERIRNLRATLVADARLPSIAALQERIALEQQIQSGERALDTFDTLLLRLGEASELWRQVQAELASLPEGDLSPNDQEKLSVLQDSFRDQLREYGLSSTSPTALSISHDTYKPIHEGFDIEFNNSASDLIRTIWAYLTGLVEVLRLFATNHPGLLILDEPRQQSTARESFGTFLRRLARARKLNEQVIVATSEESPILEGLLSGETFQYINFDGKILSRLS
jgi:hypothetical protein